MLMVSTAASTNAGLWISEFVAANVAGLEDEDGDTSDWIEIYNDSPAAVDLKGWHLSDDPGNLRKWPFPAAQLLPGQFLLVFASGKDRKEGQLHTNFQLARTGGFVALVRPDGTTIEHAYPDYPLQHSDVAYGLAGEEVMTSLLDANSTMLYHDPQLGPPGEAWMQSDFDDSDWLRGTNGIGYSTGLLDYDPLIRTPLSGTESAIFARMKFDGPVDGRLKSIGVNYDDGLALFLNGIRIASRNAPPVLTPNSLALEPHSGTMATQAESLDVSSVQYLVRTSLPEGVIASWDPVSVEGQTLKDALGKHDGILEGPQIVTDPERGPVLSLDGNDMVVIPSDPEFDLLDFTVMVWVYVTEGVNRNNRLISRDNVTGSPRYTFALRSAWSNGGRPMFQVNQNPPAFFSVAESRTPLRTGWHHLAGVRKAGDTVYIYVDGVLQGQGPDFIEAPISNDAPLSIGGYVYGEERGLFFRGLVDEVRIYNQALSGEDIAQIHAGSGIWHYQTNAENVLAIQVLNHAPADDGMLFRAELRSTREGLNTSHPPGYLVPTPYRGNGTLYPGVAATPELSPPEGVYPSDLALTLSDATAESEVRYTLDGSDPDETSPVLADSLSLHPPATLRLRRFSPGLLPSPVLELHYLDAPVRINEFLAINTSVNPDNVDLDDFSDWIELHNTSPQPVDLSGFFLTDGPEDWQKWKFPDGTMVWGNSMLLVWADGNDAAPGDIVQRDYSPYEVDRLRRLHAGFKLSGAGESILLYTPAGTLLDRVDFGPQSTDISVGRAPGANDTWLYYGEPTPGAPNTTEGVPERIWAPAVQFSVPGGLYSSAQQLALSVNDPDAVVRFTLDGARPTHQSPVLEAPITIDKSTVVRARSYKAGLLPGPERVEVYLFDTNSTLPIVSLAAYPYTLNDLEVGIFTNNFKKRDVPVHIDFYETNGAGEFHLDAGMRLIGWVIQGGDQKPVSISLDDRWGQEKLIYPLFADRDYQDFTAFVLRPGGQDGDVSFLREGLINTLLQGQMDIDYQAYRPVRVYLNGSYHGLYNLREKQNLDYLRAIHPGVGSAEIDYLEHDVIPAVLLEGKKDAYEKLVQFLDTNDLAVADNYDYVASQMDLNEFLNLQILNIYMGRYSPDHNMKFWKTVPNGRWRWVVFDVDQMWTYPSADTLAHVTSPVPQWRAPLWATIELRSLLQNASFRDEFIQRFAAHIATTFAPERVHAILNQLKSVIDPEMPLQIARWPDRIPSLTQWERNVTKLREFTDQRPAYQLAHLKNKFGLGNLSPLSISYNENQGSILVHGIPVPSNFTGRFFNGIPVRLEAVPAVGYRFAGWTGASNTLESRIAIEVAGSAQLTAAFELSPDFQIIPGRIDSDFVISNSSSAWVAGGDVEVTPAGRLILEPGATLLMPDKAGLYVQGGIEVRGTAMNPATIAANPARGARSPMYDANEPAWPVGRDARWGALVLDQPTQPVRLNYLHLSGASADLHNPANWAGIAAVNADLTLENLEIENVRQPILVRGGSVALRDSFIHISTSGDGINVKGADFALVENCDFLGGNSLDTDAIDYDQIASGQILSNQIHGFLGFNSDGIDLGEGSANIVIEGNRIYDCQDKGVSVGQASTGVLRRNIIYGCDMGVGIKDSASMAFIDRCTFYDNRVAVAAYEKNLGMGGGIARVMNSILSFSHDAAVYTDAYGTITTDYCLANTEVLTGAGNLFDGPLFVGPFLHDFRLQRTSSAIDAGNPTTELDPDGTRADLGAIPYVPMSNAVDRAAVVITEVHYNPSTFQGPDDVFEFVELYNPSDQPVPLGGYAFVSGVYFTFPAGSVLAPHQYAVVAHSALAYQGNGYPVFQWEQGNLANEGELLVLVDPAGYAVDMVLYGDRAPWPTEPDGGGPSLMLVDPSTPNATASNWRPGFGTGGTPGRANWITIGNIRFLPASSQVEITWRTSPGVVCQLEYSRSFASGVWIPLGDPVVATEDQVVFVDNVSAPSQKRFYRLRLVF